MFANLHAGMNLVFTPEVLLLICGGAFGGILIGAIPGLTATMAVALLVPVTFGMNIVPALAMLVGVYAGGISGGLIAAALLNIPGTPSSVATTFDAYPMVQQGKPEQALGLGVFASFFGGIGSGLVLTMVAPTLARFALKFGPFEYFSLVIFTFSCISSISKKSMLKSFLGAGIGLILAMVGSSPSMSIPRFTFGLDQMEGGFAIMPALIGIFAVPQLLRDIPEIGQDVCNIPSVTIKTKELFRAFRLFGKSKINLIRSSIIGIVIGILPGVGPGLSNIVAYTQAKAASKRPEAFGTGIPDGVIASESANNASMGGAMVPMLSLGIPGDSITLMMLGAFMLHGFQPGPLLFRDNGDIVFAVFVSFLVASVFVLILQLFLMRFYIKVLCISKYYLIPILFIFCVTGSFAMNNRMFDTWCFLGFGTLGYILNRTEVPVLPVILGLILGPMAEQQFGLALAMSNGSYLPFVTKPLSCIMLVTGIILLGWPMIKAVKAGRPTKLSTDGGNEA